MQKITPFLWFDNNAEEAMKFYSSVFKDSKIVSVHRYQMDAPAAGDQPARKTTIVTGTMRIAGQDIMVLNGGPIFKFNEAISLFVRCKTQAEVDYFWEKLSKGGEKGQCGWLKDKFGLSWQIVPTALEAFLQGKDPEKSKAAMNAMLQMTKLDIAKLKKAHDEAGKTKNHRRMSRRAQ